MNFVVAIFIILTIVVVASIYIIQVLAISNFLRFQAHANKPRGDHSLALLVMLRLLFLFSRRSWIVLRFACRCLAYEEALRQTISNVIVVVIVIVDIVMIISVIVVVVIQHIITVVIAIVEFYASVIDQVKQHHKQFVIVMVAVLSSVLLLVLS